MKNDFFELPKVKWLYLTGDVNKSTVYGVLVKFFHDLTCRKLLKTVNY